MLKRLDCNGLADTVCFPESETQLRLKMKYRLDFVTNSSSSSYIVNFNVNSGNIEFGFEDSMFYGDEPGSTLYYVERETKEGAPNQTYCADFNPVAELLESGLVEDPYDIPTYRLEEISGLDLSVAGDLNLSNYADMTSKKRAEALAAVMGVAGREAADDSEDDEGDYEYDDYDEEVSEGAVEVYTRTGERLRTAKQRFADMLLRCWNDSFSGTVTLSLQAEGWGEETPTAESVLRAVFGDMYKLEPILGSEGIDEETAVGMLAAEPCLKNVDRESVRKLYKFYRDCDYEYEPIEFIQTLKDGKVNYEITY